MKKDTSFSSKRISDQNKPNHDSSDSDTSSSSGASRRSRKDFAHNPNLYTTDGGYTTAAERQAQKDLQRARQQVRDTYPPTNPFNQGTKRDSGGAFAPVEATSGVPSLPLNLRDYFGDPKPSTIFEYYQEAFNESQFVQPTKMPPSKKVRSQEESSSIAGEPLPPHSETPVLSEHNSYMGSSASTTRAIREGFEQIRVRSSVTGKDLVIETSPYGLNHENRLKLQELLPEYQSLIDRQITDLQKTPTKGHALAPESLQRLKQQIDEFSTLAKPYMRDLQVMESSLQERLFKEETAILQKVAQVDRDLQRFAEVLT